MLHKVLKEWLDRRLGCIIDMIPQDFCPRIKDGVLIARILQSYGLITSEDLYKIDETSDPDVAFQNYKNHVLDWMAPLGIKCTESDILHIAQGKGGAALSLIYQLFLELEGDHIQLTDEDLKDVQDKFKVSPVEGKLTESFKLEPNPCSELLLNYWDVISWGRDHLDSLQQQYKKTREDYDKYLQNRKAKEFKFPEYPYVESAHEPIIHGEPEDVEYSYEELILEQSRAMELDKRCLEPNLKLGKKMLKELKNKRKIQIEREAVMIQMQQQLLSTVWSEIEKEKETSLNKTVAEKLRRMSEFEEKVDQKLQETRKKREEIIENRRRYDEEQQRKRDAEFIRALLEDHQDEVLKFHIERQEIIAAHRKLYEEKLRLKALKHEKLCQDVMKDVVDLALKSAEYKKLYKEAPSKAIKAEWATLFVKQQPIFDLVSPVEEIKVKLENLPQEIEEIYRREFVIQNALDDGDLEDYLKFRNIWGILEIDPEILQMITFGMNVLGYIVHRLLLQKYPLPIPDKPALSEDIEIAVCTNNVVEKDNYIAILKRMLQKKNVTVVRKEDVINSCILAYKEETLMEYDERLPDDLGEDLKVMEATKKDVKGAKGKKGKKGTKDKKSKKSKSSKSSKKSKDSKSKKGKGKKGQGKDKDEAVSALPPLKEEKITQSPKYFPWDQIVLTKKAELGKLAKAAIETDNPVEDRLFVAMFVEYLLAIPELKGWVLLNYPTNFEQAALLEQALTGRPIPKDYYDEILNETSLQSVTIAEEELFADKPNAEDDKVFEVSLSTNNTDKEFFNIGESFTLKVQDSWQILPVYESPLHDVISASSSLFVAEDVDFSVIDSRKCMSGLISSFVPTLSSPTEKGTSQMVKQGGAGFDPELLQGEDGESRRSQSAEREKLKCTCNIKEAEKVRRQSTRIFDVEASGEKSSLVNAFRSEVCHPPDLSLGSETFEKSHEPDDSNNEPMQKCSCKSLNVEAPTKSDQLVQTSAIIQATDEIDRIIGPATDEFIDKRISRVVPNPRPLEKEVYETPLTGYIKAIIKEEIDIHSEPLPIFKELERKEGLEKFYCDQGCFYCLQYEDFNSDTVKVLAKLIIGDYELPLKDSIELFGEKYWEVGLEEGDHVVLKRGKKEGKKAKKGGKDKKKKGSDGSSKGKEKKGGKGNKSKGSSKTKKGSKGKKDKNSSKSSKNKGKKGKKGKKGNDEVVASPPITFEEKEIQVPSVENLIEEPIPEIHAGEPDWIFIDLPIDKDLQLLYATLWNNSEESYVTSFKELFFTKRVLLNAIMPYILHVRTIMEEFITRPDARQYHMHQFQKNLNEIELTLRNDDETKRDLLCLIREFEEKLLGICDQKMNESEEERQKLINQNWIFRQVAEIVLNSSTAFQLELDRCIDSIQLITNYYCSIITKIHVDDQVFEKKQLQKRVLEEEQCTKAFNDPFINVTFEFPKEVNFHASLNDTLNECLEIVEAVGQDASKSVERMQNLFLPKVKGKKGDKSKTRADGLKLAKNFELDEDVKDNAGRILEEWSCALSGEIERVKHVLHLIKSELVERIEEILRWNRRVYTDIYEKIRQEYDSGLKCVKRACKLLAKAVEEEMILQPELSFEADKLAAITIALFPEVETKPEQDYKGGAFTLKQLEFMVKVLQDLAPSGYIMEKTFLLLMQDMIFQEEVSPELIEKESVERIPSSPSSYETPQHSLEEKELWRNLTTVGLEELFSKLFDCNEYIHWKDFIVCNLVLPFPSHQELMDLREQFRRFDPDLIEVVTVPDFNSVIFWFEKILNQEADITSLRTILLQLYGNGTSWFNYTLMILDFCRDDDPIAGFVKALELSLGRPICYQKELGEEYVEIILAIRNSDEEKERLRVLEHEQVTCEIRKEVDLLVDSIVHKKESTYCLDVHTKKQEEAFLDNRSILGLSNENEDSTASSSTPSRQLLLTEAKFSNAEIGFESRTNTNMAHFLPWEPVEKVITAALPWSRKVEEPDLPSFLDKIRDVYEECRRVDFNDAVLSHEFLNHPRFQEIFGNIAKFSAHNPVKMVKEIVESSCNSSSLTKKSISGSSDVQSCRSEVGSIV